MIVVKIELHSAVSGEVSEIGRMYIANDGEKSVQDPTKGDYLVKVCRRGSPGITDFYTKKRGERLGSVKDYPRLSYNVWRLIMRALRSAFPEEK